MIKFNYNPVFDSEDVAPGDILLKKDGKDTFFVTAVDAMNESYIVVSSNKMSFSSGGKFGLDQSGLVIKMYRSEEFILVRPSNE